MLTSDYLENLKNRNANKVSYVNMEQWYRVFLNFEKSQTRLPSVINAIINIKSNVGSKKYYEKMLPRINELRFDLTEDPFSNGNLTFRDLYYKDFFMMPRKTRLCFLTNCHLPF